METSITEVIGHRERFLLNRLFLIRGTVLGDHVTNPGILGGS